jgi:hypothetical protein
MDVSDQVKTVAVAPPITTVPCEFPKPMPLICSGRFAGLLAGETEVTTGGTTVKTTVVLLETPPAVTLTTPVLTEGTVAVI